jgi:hypothetical protein
VIVPFKLNISDMQCEQVLSSGEMQDWSVIVAGDRIHPSRDRPDQDD